MFSRNKWILQRQLKRITTGAEIKLLNNKIKPIFTIKNNLLKWSEERIGFSRSYSLNVIIQVPYDKASSMSGLLLYHKEFGIVWKQAMNAVSPDFKGKGDVPLHIRMRLSA